MKTPETTLAANIKHAQDWSEVGKKKPLWNSLTCPWPRARSWDRRPCSGPRRRISGNGKTTTPLLSFFDFWGFFCSKTFRPGIVLPPRRPLGCPWGTAPPWPRSRSGPGRPGGARRRRRPGEPPGRRRRPGGRTRRRGRKKRPSQIPGGDGTTGMQIIGQDSEETINSGKNNEWRSQIDPPPLLLLLFAVSAVVAVVSLEDLAVAVRNFKSLALFLYIFCAAAAASFHLLPFSPMCAPTLNSIRGKGWPKEKIFFGKKIFFARRF